MTIKVLMPHANPRVPLATNDAKGSEAAQGLADLTERLVVTLHAIGEDVRSGRTPHFERMAEASNLAVALLDEIEATIDALGSTPADTPEGIKLRSTVSDALAQLSVYQRVVEFSRL